MYRDNKGREYTTHSEIRAAFSKTLPDVITQADLDAIGIQVITSEMQLREKVSRLIMGTNWRLERARERDSIGAEGESIQDVLREREAIRRAGNRVSRVEDYEVLEQDYPANEVITRLQFMRRFTDTERENIRAVRDGGQSQELLDFWELLQLAADVNLNDVDIQEGVAMLEASGLLSTGRSLVILEM